jgi:hypothetical protein
MASLLVHVASGGNAVLRLRMTHAYASRTRLYPLKSCPATGLNRPMGDPVG